MKIFAITDIHGETKYIEKASQLISEADLVTISGDITSSGKSEEAERILKVVEDINSNILAVHGNWDRVEVLDFLEEKGYNLHSQGKVFENIGFFGLGGSNKTPMHTPTEYSEEELHEYLQMGYVQIKELPRIVLLSHVPPKNSRDRTFLGLRGGSVSVRDFIQRNRVDLCIAGHIHEASGVETKDPTVVVNPGTFKKGKYAMIEISDTIHAALDKVKK